MSKRFTDTNKWRKIWFRGLKPVEKCFWLYLCDNCDHAGIWEVDFELAQIFIGEPLDIPSIQLSFKKQYEELGGGKKWFLHDFVEFQYGELNEHNRDHASVISILKNEGAYKGLIRSLEAHKDKDKDKDKDKEGVWGNNEEVKKRSKVQKLTDEEWLESLKSNPAYVGIDVIELYHKMLAWCEVQGKKPTRARLLNWLNRQEKPMTGGNGKGKLSISEVQRDSIKNDIREIQKRIERYKKTLHDCPENHPDIMKYQSWITRGEVEISTLEAKIEG